eukprot:CAMPEP_0197451944 /NCGR_PEP_ID=MMETSP1175-20131217/30652_1 /TAXON_ID=1003142 /ORGANISM="Triceratium dubium, Strain CCMP147" /LENGTH=1026 /DNA_ID=CAMNT_0042984823 /DNA_START=65 /DNA_END=3146 /DNA_ORIENTATION=-
MSCKSKVAIDSGDGNRSGSPELWWFALSSSSPLSSEEATSADLRSALEGVAGHRGSTSLDFLADRRLLVRPPFSFVRAVGSMFMQGIGLFGNNGNDGGDDGNADSNGVRLFDDRELDPTASLDRTEKIRFLTKLLAIVAFVTKIRVDVYMSPSRILSGHDADHTRLFLRTLAHVAGNHPREDWEEAAREVVRIGPTALYKRSVRVRNAIVALQAMVRGMLARGGGLGSKSKVDRPSISVPADGAQYVYHTTANFRTKGCADAVELCGMQTATTGQGESCHTMHSSLLEPISTEKSENGESKNVRSGKGGANYLLIASENSALLVRREHKIAGAHGEGVEETSTRTGDDSMLLSHSKRDRDGQRIQSTDISNCSPSDGISRRRSRSPDGARRGIERKASQSSLITLQRRNNNVLDPGALPSAKDASMEDVVHHVREKRESELSHLRLVLDNERQRQRSRLQQRLDGHRGGYSSSPNTSAYTPPCSRRRGHRCEWRPPSSAPAPVGSSCVWEQGSNHDDSVSRLPLLLNSWLPRGAKGQSHQEARSPRGVLKLSFAHKAVGNDSPPVNDSKIKEEERAKKCARQMRKLMEKEKRIQARLDEALVKEDNLRHKEERLAHLAEALRKRQQRLQRREDAHVLLVDEGVAKGGELGGHAPLGSSSADANAAACKECHVKSDKIARLQRKLSDQSGALTRQEEEVHYLRRRLKEMEAESAQMLFSGSSKPTIAIRVPTVVQRRLRGRNMKKTSANHDQSTKRVKWPDGQRHRPNRVPLITRQSSSVSPEEVHGETPRVHNTNKGHPVKAPKETSPAKKHWGEGKENFVDQRRQTRDTVPFEEVLQHGDMDRSSAVVKQSLDIARVMRKHEAGVESSTLCAHQESSSPTSQNSSCESDPTPSKRPRRTKRKRRNASKRASKQDSTTFQEKRTLQQNVPQRAAPSNETDGGGAQDLQLDLPDFSLIKSTEISAKRYQGYKFSFDDAHDACMLNDNKISSGSREEQKEAGDASAKDRTAAKSGGFIAILMLKWQLP